MSVSATAPEAPHDDTDKKLKPRRSRRLGVDNAEYKPGEETEEDDGVEDGGDGVGAGGKGKLKRGLKRTRTSMLKEEAQDSQQQSQQSPSQPRPKKRKKRSVQVPIDG